MLEADRAARNEAPSNPPAAQLRLLLQSSGKLPRPRPLGTEAIDPKSDEAAGELVRGLRRADQQRRSTKPRSCSAAMRRRGQRFDRQFARDSQPHVRDRKPLGDQEGAAGSIYVTVPLTIFTAIAVASISQRSADVDPAPGQ